MTLSTYTQCRSCELHPPLDLQHYGHKLSYCYHKMSLVLLLFVVIMGLLCENGVSGIVEKIGLTQIYEISWKF
jgi:hypothetical protein